jgi:hypothetical protein
MKPLARSLVFILGFLFFALPTNTPGNPREGDNVFRDSPADRSIPAPDGQFITVQALSGLLSAPVPYRPASQTAKNPP